MVNVGLLVVSLFFLGTGVLQLLWPQTIATHKTRWDAIRTSDQSSATTPANWMVKYTRLGGLLFLGIGTLFLVLSTDLI